LHEREFVRGYGVERDRVRLIEWDEKVRIVEIKSKIKRNERKRILNKAVGIARKQHFILM
jgi:hypothetical protein